MSTLKKTGRDRDSGHAVKSPVYFSFDPRIFHQSENCVPQVGFSLGPHKPFLSCCLVIDTKLYHPYWRRRRRCPCKRRASCVVCPFAARTHRSSSRPQHLPTEGANSPATFPHPTLSSLPTNANSRGNRGGGGRGGLGGEGVRARRMDES
ncbi:unnamed protein product [Ectocarpus sp. 12 AP-2014]